MGKVTACHNCKYNGKRDLHCLTCRRVDQDDIRIHKTPHAIGEISATDIANDTASGCTQLAPDDENRLRVAMASLFGLDPVQLLLVQHLMTGGRLVTFGGVLHRLANRVAHLHGRQRSHARMMAQAIMSKTPQLAPVLRVLINRDQDEEVKEKKISIGRFRVKMK